MGDRFESDILHHINTSMKALLVIIFLINGEPTLIMDGYAPMEIDADRCDSSVEFTTSYINSVPDIPELYGVFCDTEEEILQQFDKLFSSIPI
jgi:hypothetical protein